MWQYIQELFSMAQFVPHAVCLLWRPDLLIMHGVSDLLIATAYFTIPILIVKAVRARPDLMNGKVAWMFAAFIMACGLSHAAGLLTLWYPAYGFQGMIKVGTAGISVYTAIQLVRLLPDFIAMPSTAQYAESKAELISQGGIIAEQKFRLEVADQLGLLLPLIQLSSDAIVVWTHDDGILFWSDGAEKTYGYTRDEAVNSVSAELLKPRYPEPPANIYAAIDQNGDWQGDIQETRKDGSHVIVAARLQSIVLDQRRYYLAISRDVTAERAAAEKAETLSRLVELSHDAILTRTPDASIDFWNEGARKLYGYGSDEAIGQSEHELLQATQDVPREKVREIIEETGEWVGEIEQRTKTGQVVTVLSRQQAIEVAGNKLLLEINRDVTSQRAIERDHAQLAEVLDNISLPIWIMSADGHFLYINSAYSKSYPEMVDFFRPGRSVLDALVAKSRAGYFELDGLQPEEWAQNTYNQLQSDQSLKDMRTTAGQILEWICTPISDGSKLIIRRDVTEEAKRIDEIERLNKELHRSNRELDDFAYIASHDLKEPLRGIAINANFLSREKLSAKGEERVSRMTYLTGRMEQLISDLLFFSRLGRGEKLSQDIDPRSIIEGISIELTEWLNERQGNIVFADNLPWIRADPSKIKTVFQNLIVNGVKYSDAKVKTVEIGFDAFVKVNNLPLRNVFWVRDNGIGIDAKNRDKIFRIFQRLNREEDYGPGTGAGLSFVRKIVEDYGGTVTFTSELGQGTIFYVSLPLAEGVG